MRGLQELTLAEAVRQIRATCDRHERPFFFLVGAGVSHPPVPLALAIIDDCKRRAQEYGPVADSPSKGPADAYSYWFQRAHPSPADRQAYLRQLIEGKFISHANFRLASISTRNNSVNTNGVFGGEVTT